MTPLARSFIAFALRVGVLKLGSFATKSGRISPYFFNLGEVCRGRDLVELAGYYVDLMLEKQLTPDVLFGPAYKGIPLVGAIATHLAHRKAMDVALAFNRKEQKQHGEEGIWVGASAQDKNVLIVDDVLTSGMSVWESIDIIRQHGGHVTDVMIAFDRQEVQDHGSPEVLSSPRDILAQQGVSVWTMAKLDDLLFFLQQDPYLHQHIETIQGYQEHYGCPRALAKHKESR